MDVKSIKKLAEESRFDEALNRCDDLLKTFPERESKILRTRAYVYALMGNYEKALADREAVLEIGQTTLADYFRAGENALSLGRHDQAIVWLNETIRLGVQQNETWFGSATYLLLAHAQMELGHYEEALVNLDHAINMDQKCAMPLPGLGMCDTECLRAEIYRRQERT